MRESRRQAARHGGEDLGRLVTVIADHTGLRGGDGVAGDALGPAGGGGQGLGGYLAGARGLRFTHRRAGHLVGGHIEARARDGSEYWLWMQAGLGFSSCG
ncbi:hypothetical protein D9M70_505910 [compost metagenome]